MNKKLISLIAGAAIVAAATGCSETATSSVAGTDIRSRHIFRSIIYSYRGTQRHTVNERLNINGKSYQGC
ncbi:MAG: hypothetical protein V8T26_04005 [[Eubacterium] siraeum]